MYYNRWLENSDDYSFIYIYDIDTGKTKPALYINENIFTGSALSGNKSYKITWGSPGVNYEYMILKPELWNDIIKEKYTEASESQAKWCNNHILKNSSKVIKKLFEGNK